MKILKNLAVYLLCIAMTAAATSFTAFAEEAETAFDGLYKEFDFEEYTDGTKQNNDYGVIEMNKEKIIIGGTAGSVTHNGAYSRYASIMKNENDGNQYLRFVNAGNSGSDTVPFTGFSDFITEKGAESFVISYDIMLDTKPNSPVQIRYKTNYGFLMLFFKEDKLYYRNDGNSAWSDNLSFAENVTIESNEWNKIAYSYSNGTLKLFFNGIKICEKSGFSSAEEAAYSWLYFGAVPNVSAICIDNLRYECFNNNGEYAASAELKSCDDLYKVSGKLNHNASIDLTITVSSQNGSELYAKSLKTDENGGFSAEFTLDKPDETNISTVAVNINPIFTSAPCTIAFNHYNDADALSALDFTGYDEESVAAFKDRINSDTVFYNIDIGENSDFEKLSENDLIIKSLCGKKYNSVSEFNKSFKRELTLQFLRERKDAEEVATMLEGNSDTFDFEPSESYYKYRLLISSLLINNIEYVTDVETLKKFLKKAEIYYSLVNETRLKIADTVEALKDELFGYGMSLKYSSVNSSVKKAAADAILDANLNVDSEFDLSENMQKLIGIMNDILNKPKSDDNSGDSKRPSGGGGGGRIGKVSIPKQKNNDDTINLPIPETSGYNDVEAGFWAEKAIDYVSKNGIMIGDGKGNFMPNESITREQMTKIVVKAFNITAKTSTHCFDDVDKSMWYAEFIDTAASAGLITGMSSNEFGLGKAVSRQDAAVILYRYFMTSKREFKAEENTGIEDEAEIAGYAKEAVEFVRKNGIMVGSDGRFEPNMPLTRAMAANIIYNITVK